MNRMTWSWKTWAILVLTIVSLINSTNLGNGIAHGQDCQLFPIALSAQQLSNAVPGSILTNIYNGIQPGNFGWLSWGGSPSEPTLVGSLTYPGNSSTYVNPNNPNDHQINVGDWVQSKPGVSNSKNVRDALTALEAVDITVPVWDLSTGQGSNAKYRICGFAGVRLISYQLPSQNRITARFLGYTTCNSVNLAPLVSAGSDQSIVLPANAVLNGRIVDDGLPAGGLLTARWSEVSGPGAASLTVTTLTNGLNGVPVTNQLSTTVTFTLPGTYVFRLTASDSLLAATNDVVVTVNRANSAPVANSQSVTLDENASTNITLHGSDPDGDPLSYVVMTLPNYGTLSGTPPNLVYAPKPDFSGQDSFTFKVNDGLLDSPGATVGITIRHVNVAPTADSQSLTNYENTAFPIVLSGSDVEGSPLTYHIVSGPTNGTLTGSVTNLTYTPRTNYFGKDVFVFNANDGLTNSAPALVNITILPVDEPPVVDAGADQLIILPTNSVYLSGTVQYDDFPGTVDAVLWGKASGPGSVIFNDPSNEVTTATFSQSGTFVLRLIASDSFLSGTDEVVVTVDGPPMVSAGLDQTNTLPATAYLNGTVSDDGLPTNGTVAIAWSKVSGPGTVVFSAAGLTNSTATFSQGGTYVLRLTANDGLAATSDDVTVVMNEAPIVDAGSDQVVTNLQVALNGTAFDDGLPNGVLTTTWSKISGPGTASFVSISSPATTVTFSKTGTYVLQLTAGDSLATVSKQVVIAVDAAPAVVVTGDQIVNLPALANLTATATDDGLPTNSVLTYGWSQASGPGTINFSDNAALATTAAFSTSGVYVVQFAASDSLLSAMTNFTVIANLAPTVRVSADKTVVNLPHVVSLSGLVSDDGLPYGTLTYSWTQVAGPGAVTFANPTANNSTAAFSQTGVYTLRLTANDSAAAGSADITITVLPVNQPPVVSAGASQVENYSGSVKLAGTATDDGFPSQSLTTLWSLVSGPGTVGFNATSATNAVATFSQAGVYVLRLTANDSEYASSSDVTVSLNLAPVVDAGADQLVSQTNQARLVGTVIDDGLPQGTLTTVWSLGSGPGTASFDAATTTNLLTGATITNHPATTVTFSQPGVYVLKLTANDSLATNVSQVTIAVNQAPLVNAGANQIVTAPGTLATLNGTAADDGLPTGSVLSVTWSVISGPGTATFADATTTNTTVSFDQPGAYGLRLTASDSLLSSSSDVTLTVQAVNQPPLVNAGNSQTNLFPASASLSGTASDDGLPSGGTLTVVWNVVSGPGTVAFNDANRTNAVATFSQPGVYVLRLVANDSQLSATNQVVIIEDSAPVVDAGTSQFVSGTNQVNLAGLVKDDGLPPGAVLTSVWSKVSGPGSVSFSVPTQTTALSGTSITNQFPTRATFSQPGVYVLRLSADDSVASGSATVTISLNQPPLVTAGSSLTNNLGATMTLSGTVTDDGLPVGAPVIATWSQLSGPGIISFANSHLTNTTVTASAGGIYTLRLTANDTVSTNFSDVSIRFNRAPQGLSQTNLVQQGQSVPIILGGSDPDGDAVTFALVANPASGSLTGTAPNFIYTPNAGFYGQDGFTFVVNDGMATSVVAQVSITVTPIPRSRTYTTDADFNEGQYFKSNLEVTNNQVILRSKLEAFHNIWVANSSKGTIIRIDTETGEIKGEYKSAPDGEPLNPSRTTVDLDGSVWAGNRNGNSVVHISVPESNLWRDRNTNGVLNTSTGLGDVLPWSNPNNVDSGGGVSSAQDELITHYVKVRSSGTRHVSVDANNNVWVSGTGSHQWDLIDGSTGQIIRQEPSVGYGGYGGLIDRHGVIWSARPLMRWDTSKPLSGTNWLGYSEESYGMGLDSLGNVWVSTLNGSGKIRKIAPDGTILGLYNQGSPNAQGVAVGLDDDVWVASSLLGGTTVGHLKNDGTFVGNITVGQGPTGVAVDSNGKIWVAHYNSGNVMRIDPNAGPIGADGVTPVGQVDYTSPYLGGNLYNYSDMTGSTLIGFPGNGTWSVVYDSSITHAQWGPVSWNSKIYDDGKLRVSFATSDNGTNYGAAETLAQPNQTPVSLGRYAKLTVTFVRSSSGQGPVLDDITLGTAGYNNAPVVQPTVNIDAGLDRDLQLPLSAALHASIWHNGFFNYSTNQVFLWSKVSGPGTVSFSSSNAPTTSAQFSSQGVYDVRVQTTLLGTVYSDDVNINAIPINRSPWVDVGPDRALRFTNQVLHVDAIVRDDGLPFGSTLSLQWSKIIGPGTVTFSQPNSATNDITFSAPGLYVLQLSASDGSLSYSSRMEVRVQEVCEVAAPDGIAQWWPGNGSTKETVRGNDIYLLNGATNAPGQISYGFLFNGSTNYAKAYEHPALDIGSGDGVTIEFWAKATSPGRLFEWYRNGVNGVYADFNTSGGTLTVHLIATNGTDHSFSVGSVLNSSQFQHVAITYDKNSGAAFVYINGVISYSGNLGSFTPRTTGDFYLAGNPQIAINGRFGGVIDEMTLYSRVLNPYQIYEIATANFVGKCPVGDNQAPVVYAGGPIDIPQAGTLVQLNGSVNDDAKPAGNQLYTEWRMLNGPGNVIFANSNNPTTTAIFPVSGIYTLQLYADDAEKSAHDEAEARISALCTVKNVQNLVGWWTGNNKSPADALGGNPAIRVNGATFTDGEVGTCFQLDGVNDYLKISAATNYDVGKSAAGFTVEFWAKAGAVGNDTAVVGWNNGVNDRGVKLYEYSDNLYVTVWETNGTAHFVGNIGGVFNNTWRHIALTYDRVTGLARVYVDGVIRLAPNIGSFVPQTDYDFYVGTWPGLRFFAGQVDEVSLYTRPLTTNEIQSIYGAGSAGKCITPPNQPPVVIAGGNQTTYFPTNTVTLHGSTYDDGLPGNTLTVAWDYLVGPGSILFGSPNQPVTTVNFTNTGVYIFQLSASDGQYTSTNTTTITVLPDPRIPPSVAISSPVDGTRIRVHAAGTNLTVSATVSDPDDGIAGVSFYQNGVSLASLTSGPYNVTVNNLLPGNYAFQAVATDLSGLSTTSAPVNVTLYVGTNPPAIAFTSPVNGSVFEVPANGTTNLVLNASASDSDGRVVHVDFFQNGTSLATFTNTPYTLAVSNLPAGTYTFTSVATDDDGLTRTSAPVTATVFVDGGAPTVAIFAPDDAGIVTAPAAVVGTAYSPILQSYHLQYRYKNAEDATPAAWMVFATGSTSAVSNSLGSLDPTLLLNGIYEMQLVATDLKGRTVSTAIQTFVVDRNLKIGNFTISFNDLAVPVPGLPIQITRTYDSRAAASGVQGDFGAGWTMDIRNVRLQKNRSLSRNWNETVTGNPDVGDLSTAYHLDPGSPRIVTITFPDGRVEKFQFIPNPMDQALVPIDTPQWRFIPIGNTRGTLLPAAYGEVDGNFLYFSGPIPGTADLYDFNFFWDFVGDFSTSVTLADLQRYPTLFRYTSAEGYQYLIDEVKGLQSVTDPNNNTLVIATNGLVWKNPNSGTNSVSVAFNRDQLGRITNIVDLAGNSLNYRYDTNNNLAVFTDRVGQTNGFAYTNVAFPHYLTSISDARGVTPVQNQFDVNGRLVGNTDAFGNAISYGHDLANNREYVTNRLGQVTASDYDDHGNVIHTIAPDGGETFTSYDEDGNVLTVTDPLGHTTTYTYDGQDNRTSVTDPLGNVTRFTYGAQRRVTSVTDPRGNSITNTFNALGNLTAMRDPLGHVTRFAYDANGNPVSMTNALGQSMSFVYDGAGRLAAELDALGHETDYQRDNSGNLLAQTTTRTTSGGLQTLTVQFQYDAQSRLTNSIFPDGSSARTIYNAIGKPATTIDQQGRQTSMQYDALGRVTRTIYPDNFSDSSAYDAEGRRIASTNRIGQVTRYEYDVMGRLVHTIYSDGTGSTSTNYFNLGGQLIASTDVNGNHTFYGYDAAGRSVAVTNALGQVSRSFYDASGNLTNSIDALGRSTTFIYDALNRRVQTIFADGTTQQTWFDELGRRTYEQDQAGKVTAFGYDTLGRMTTVTNALGYVTSYGYDELGQQISQTDANQHTTTFEYDSLGRRVKRTLPGNQVETYAYSIGGLLTNKTDFNGYHTEYQYDSMNRLLAKVPDPSRNEPTVSYTYNVLGLRTGMADAGGSSTYGYDGRNRLTSKSERWNLPSGARYTSILNYNYDALGNLTNIVSSDPNGVNVRYGYDGLSRLNAVGDAGAGTTGYGYDAVGNLQSCTYPNLVHSEYQYDALNRLTNLNSSQLLAPIANYAYTVGLAGNRLTATEQLFASGINAQLKTINRIYTYDDIYRLTSETINGTPSTALASYNYDPVGNRQSRGGSLLTPQTFNFDVNDHLNTDTYDANGNTLFGAGFGQSQADQYDFENHLTVRHTPTSTITIKYDGDGNRVSKTITTATNTVTTCYQVDELNPSGYAQVVEEYTSVNSQQPTINCVYTYGHTLISQRRLDGALWTTSFYGYDGHNNVRYLTDANGTVADTYDYDAFGNLTAASGSTVNCYLFTGEQLDVDLGLYYLRARYHNPDTGRFWNTDSFEGNGSDPASLHKYTYCQNNPLNGFDPSGHEFDLGTTMFASNMSVTARALVIGFCATLGGTISALDTAIGSNFNASQSQLNSAYWSGFKAGAVFGAVGMIAPTATLAAGLTLGVQGVVDGIAEAMYSSGDDSYGKWCQVLFRASTLGLASAFTFGGYGEPTYSDLEGAYENFYAPDEELYAYDDLELSVDDAGNVTFNEPKIHGNSLDTQRTAQGYTLRDKATGEILKYGETIRGIARYTKKYLADNNADMVFETSGSKRAMRSWETEQILNYMANNGGKRPKLNKSNH